MLPDIPVNNKMRLLIEALDRLRWPVARVAWRFAAIAPYIPAPETVFIQLDDVKDESDG